MAVRAIQPLRQVTLRTEEVTREELGREKFLERAWAWKEKYHSLITTQIRRLGASCDWSRERFTLDEGLSRAVREAFVHLYDKGLIYRGPRLINWSPGLKTAVSDLEVEYEEEPGKLYYFKYMLATQDGSPSQEFIPVATTRRRPSWAIPPWRCIPKTSATRNTSGAASSCRS